MSVTSIFQKGSLNHSISVRLKLGLYLFKLNEHQLQFGPAIAKQTYMLQQNLQTQSFENTLTDESSSVESTAITPQSLLSNDELEVKLQSLVSDERKRTAEILHLINLAEERRLYLHRGFGSLFDWLTKGLSYSEAAAHRRIQAARLMQAVPEVARKVSSGEVNLTTLSKTQSAIRFEEKLTGVKLSPTAKAQVIEKIENKTIRDTDKALLERFPKLISRLEYEYRTEVTSTITKLTLNLSGETLDNLERIKNLVSHKFPEATFAQVIGYLAKQYLEKKDPLMKTKIKNTSAAAKQCVEVEDRMTPSLRNKVIQRDQGRCTFKDFKTGQVCGSTYQIEVDHILPKALGGKNDLNNLRCLCRKHNALMAEKNLGVKKANEWRHEKPKNTIDTWECLLTPYQHIKNQSG